MLFNREPHIKTINQVPPPTTQNAHSLKTPHTAGEDLEKRQPSTFALGTVNWRKPGPRTGGSFCKHLTGPITLCILLNAGTAQAENVSPAKTPTLQSSPHQYLSQARTACTHSVHLQRQMDEHVAHTQTHTDTHILIHIFTGI